ncbi:MAG: HPF/RaiA family ribosome-associated protein [Myxococcota bacterium]
MTNRIHFHDLPHSRRVKEEFERLATSLRDEFPEIQKLEVSLNHSHEDKETHVHVTGKDLELAARAACRELHDSLVEAFDRLRRQLRKRHDKVIYARRREAQKNSRG